MQSLRVFFVPFLLAFCFSAQVLADGEEQAGISFRVDDLVELRLPLSWLAGARVSGGPFLRLRDGTAMRLETVDADRLRREGTRLDDEVTVRDWGRFVGGRATACGRSVARCTRWQVRRDELLKLLGVRTIRWLRWSAGDLVALLQAEGMTLLVLRDGRSDRMTLIHVVSREPERLLKTLMRGIHLPMSRDDPAALQSSSVPGCPCASRFCLLPSSRA